MSKGISGYFKNTLGAIEMQHFHLAPPETTAIVWRHIKPTNEEYLGTILPKSFVIDVPKTNETPAGKMWTHGNATEHMYEAISSTKDNPLIKSSNPNLYTQFILYDYYKTIGTVVRSSISYEKKITYGHWEFVFARARSADKYPVVKHAKFIGLK